MRTYIMQEEYKMFYICWKCEKATEHTIEKCLISDSGTLTYLSFCPKCDRYEEFDSLDELDEREIKER